MTLAPYTEDILVQQIAADHLEQQLGWRSVYTFNSIPRNPLLFAMLHRMEAVEHISSGIKRIRNLCREYGVAKPRIGISEHWFTVIFPRPESQAEPEVFPTTGTHPLRTTSVPSLSQEAQEAQEAQAEAQEAQVVLLAWEVAVLEHCVDHDATGAELLERAGYSIRTGNFKRGLDKLLNKGFLAMSIPGKPRSSKQKYRLTALGKKLLEAQDMVKG